MLKHWKRLLVTCLAAALVSGGIVWTIAGSLVAPKNRPLGPPPDDLPILTERVASDSGSDLAVWRIEAPGAHATVVLLHPLGGSRRSMLPHARMLHEAGYSTILPDFQGHGESRGEFITLGHLEGLDAIAVIEHARALHPDRPIGVIGRSLGGAAALLAPPLEIDALVLEAVYPTIEEAVDNRLRMRLGDLGTLASPLLTMQLQPRLGIRPEQLRPIDRIGEVGCPVLVVSGDQDERTTLAQTEQLFAAASEPKELLVVRGAHHVSLIRHSPELYQERVLAFFQEHLGEPVREMAEGGVAAERRNPLRVSVRDYSGFRTAVASGSG